MILNSGVGALLNVLEAYMDEAVGRLNPPEVLYKFLGLYKLEVLGALVD